MAKNWEDTYRAWKWKLLSNEHSPRPTDGEKGAEKTIDNQIPLRVPNWDSSAGSWKGGESKAFHSLIYLACCQPSKVERLCNGD